MNIISKISQKKKANELIETYTFIYKQALNSLNLVTQNYCNYYYGNKNKVIPFSKINISIATFGSYVSQMVKYEKQLMEYFQNNRYHSLYYKVEDYLNELKNDLISIIDNYQSLYQYKDSQELQQIVNLLCDAKRNFRGMKYHNLQRCVNSIKLI